MIVGYGRIGGLVGEMLKRHDMPFVAVENVVSLVAEAREDGVEIYWGNATRRDFLMRCGAGAGARAGRDDRKRPCGRGDRAPGA